MFHDLNILFILSVIAKKFELFFINIGTHFMSENPWKSPEALNEGEFNTSFA